MGFRLEAVMICVDYADFAAETIPLNQRHFDDFVVVTAPEDKATQRVCAYYGVRQVWSDRFRSRWGEFHKAKGINHGLENLKLDDWVLHLDADIILPPKTRTLLKRANLDKTCLYGCDRFLVPGSDEWRVHQAMPHLQQDNYHVQMDAFPLAPRFSGERMGGYAPPGYFQLWNPNWSNVREYPSEHTDAAKTDVLFSSKWWRNKRQLLPEFVAYHLDSSGTNPQGANWGGRVTGRFGAQPDEADKHHPRHHKHPPHHHKHHKHHHHPYGPGPYKEEE